MKRIARLAALVGLGLGLISGPAKAQTPIEMIITDELSTTHWSTKIIDDYAKTIQERTQGRIVPKVFHAGTLYKDQDAVAALGSGAVHMVWPVAVRLETIAPETGVISLPFAITDEMMMHQGAPEAIGKFLSQYVEPSGIRVMGLARTADLFFIFRDQFIEKIGDLEGQKVRVTGGRVLLNLMREFGASPVSMSAADMAPALMQGAIDGIFTSAGGWEIVGPSAAPKASLVPGLSLVTYAVLVDDAWLKGLPEDLRKVVEDTTLELIRTNWPVAKKLDQETFDRMLKNGGEAKQVSDQAREEFRKAALEANKEFIDRHPDVWAKFQEVTKPFQSTQ
ncbi:TRAP transporter substrate-binding protein DctP [Rhodoligotrophos ferricapiens]|uniref:TRAP transporter substrate-binding protein DctP n=1 Tax=Rhodoligotrophos ferricapiens TaxID=3069264 RepID=UPI00315D954A